MSLSTCVSIQFNGVITFGSDGNDVVIWSVLVIDIMGAELNLTQMKNKKQVD